MFLRTLSYKNQCTYNLTIFSLLLFVPPDDTQSIQNNSSSNQTTVRSSNGNELYDVQKKQSSTSSSSSTTKSAVSKKQSQHRTGGGGLNKRSEKMLNHQWLLTSLKGHTDHVLDIDYSSNGKYLASCSEGMLHFVMEFLENCFFFFLLCKDPLIHPG